MQLNNKQKRVHDLDITCHEMTEFTMPSFQLIGVDVISVVPSSWKENDFVSLVSSK
jgi:hypothetical protein